MWKGDEIFDGKNGKVMKYLMEKWRHLGGILETKKKSPTKSIGSR